MFNVDRALLHTRTARCTCPQCIGVHIVADQLLVPYRLLFGCKLLVVLLLENQRGLVHRTIVDGDDDTARIKYLARLVRRAHACAASTVRTRVTIEQRLPREIFDVDNTKLLYTLFFKVDRLHCIGRGKRAKEDIRDRCKHMQVLGIRQVVHKCQDEQRMRPPSNLKNKM